MFNSFTIWFAGSSWNLQKPVHCQKHEMGHLFLKGTYRWECFIVFITPPCRVIVYGQMQCVQCTICSQAPCCSSVLCLRNIWDLLPLLNSPYTLTYIHFFGRGYFVQNNLSVHHTKWCVQQTSDRHPYQWKEDNKKLCVFCIVLSSVQFISDLVSSEWCSFSYPCFLSSMQPTVVTSCFGFLWGFACFFMFLYVSLVRFKKSKSCQKHLCNSP